MKIYIAAHDKWAACYVADKLYDEGHAVVSTWHQKDFLPTESYSDKTRADIASRDVEEVLGADALVLIACRERVPGGKFVEAGIALGAGKQVIVLGHRENMLLWLTQIQQVDTIDQLVRLLR